MKCSEVSGLLLALVLSICWRGALAQQALQDTNRDLVDDFPRNLAAIIANSLVLFSIFFGYALALVSIYTTTEAAGKPKAIVRSRVRRELPASLEDAIEDAEKWRGSHKQDGSSDTIVSVKSPWQYFRDNTFLEEAVKDEEPHGEENDRTFMETLLKKIIPGIQSFIIDPELQEIIQETVEAIENTLIHDVMSNAIYKIKGTVKKTTTWQSIEEILYNVKAIVMRRNVIGNVLSLLSQLQRIFDAYFVPNINNDSQISSKIFLGNTLDETNSHKDSNNKINYYNINSLLTNMSNIKQVSTNNEKYIDNLDIDSSYQSADRNSGIIKQYKVIQRKNIIPKKYNILNKKKSKTFNQKSRQNQEYKTTTIPEKHT